MPPAIADSAFLVNELRARNTALSRDVFAHLWVNDHTRQICKNYDGLVYPDDEISLGVRNRFFLELIESFFASQPDGILVNVGSGFTNYPFLLDRDFPVIEIDFPHVVDYKSRHLEQFYQAGLIPLRHIEFVGADLNDGHDRNALAAKLSADSRLAKSFIVIEGLTYYLNSESLDELFQIAAGLQRVGSMVAFDFWTPDLETQPTCAKFRGFLENQLGFKNRHYNYMSTASLRSVDGYRLSELTDVLEMQLKYVPVPVLNQRYGVLDAYAVLTRTE
jgi:O-methyltransferase involved in polyketide biosynthesis